MRPLLLALALAAASQAAPAPVPPEKAAKAKAPAGAYRANFADLLGGWDMHWQLGKGQADFQRGGGYSCHWAGHWRLKGRTLTVTEGGIPETADSPISDPITWTVELTAPRSGEVTHEGRRGPFKLERPD